MESDRTMAEPYVALVGHAPSTLRPGDDVGLGYAVPVTQRALSGLLDQMRRDADLIRQAIHNADPAVDPADIVYGLEVRTAKPVDRRYPMEA